MLKLTAALVMSTLLLACNNQPDVYEERDGLLEENLHLHTRVDSLKAELDTCDSLLVIIEYDLIQGGHITFDSTEVSYSNN